jgi:hypothetical protein
MNADQAIVSELSAITGLSGKIFPVDAQQGVSAPYAVYHCINGTDRKKVLLGFEGNIEIPYQLNVYHTSYANVKSLLANVVSEIKTWEQTNIGVTGPYVQACTLDDEIYFYDDEVKLYQGSVNFTICYTE